MSRFWVLRALPALVACFVLAAPPASAQGGDIGRQMEKEYGVVGRDTYEGRRLNDQLDRVVERIIRAVNTQSDTADFRLKGARLLGGRSEKTDRIINAFALPDGRIYVTLGLMRALADSSRASDELAFVVGHEVTHVTEKHSDHQRKKSLPVGIGAILLGVLTKNKTVGDLAGMGAAAYSSSFSRKDEYRADRGGLLAMWRAGYDLDSAVSMLKRLRAKGEEDNRLLNGLFGSHPLTGNRIDRIKEMIADIRAGREIDDRSEKDLERDDRRRR